MTEDCSRNIYDGTYSGHPCPNKGKVAVKGKWFCGTHSPGAAKRREERRTYRQSLHLAKVTQRIARADRLTAAQDGVVKALEGFCTWIETQPAGSTSAETEYEDGGAALKELRAAQG